MNFVSIPSSLDLRHKSPGISAIYQQIRSSRHNRILDLGSFSAANFEFFSQFSNKIHFENFDDYLKNNVALMYNEALGEGLDDYLSEFSDIAPFNVVLTWDIFNFLDLRTIEMLFQRLSPYCAKNALVHLIKHFGTNTPSLPSRFQVLSETELRVSRPTAQLPKSRHRHTMANMIKQLPQYNIHSTYMNHEGMQPWMNEVILKYVPQKKENLPIDSNGVAAESSKERPARALTATAPKLIHTSHALREVLASLDNCAFPKVLDLGLKNKTVYDHFFPLSSGVYTRDVYSLLQEGKELKSILNFNQSVQFDVILLWDTANFYTPEQIRQMFVVLSKHMHPGTLVYAMVYTGRETPSQPQRLQMLGSETLAVYPSVKSCNQRPLTSSCLLKAMGHCQLKDTFIFRPGMQTGISEYLFTSKI